MRFLKGIGVLILIVIALLLIIAFFLPSKTEFSQTIEIYRTPAEIFPYVNDLKEHEIFSPWYCSDTSTKISYDSYTIGVGAIQRWESQSSGDGSQKIIWSRTNELVKIEIDLIKCGSGLNSIHLEETDSGTIVTWSFESNLKYPIERFKGLLISRKLNKNVDKSLNKLSKISNESN